MKVGKELNGWVQAYFNGWDWRKLIHCGGGIHFVHQFTILPLPIIEGYHTSSMIHFCMDQQLQELGGQNAAFLSI